MSTARRTARLPAPALAGLVLDLAWTALCTPLLVRRRAEDGARVDRVADAVR